MMKRMVVLVAVMLATLNVYAHASVMYDGIWFLGFNMQHDVFSGSKGLSLRYDINSAISKNAVVGIIGDTLVPNDVVPPGLEGYSTQAALPSGNPHHSYRLTLRLLHTDGVKTRQIIERIREDLGKLGIELETIEIPYREQDRWISRLEEGNYDLFIMGFKAYNFYDTGSFIQPLFASDGEANFMNYANSQVDEFIRMYGESRIDEEKEVLLKKVSQQVRSDLPLIPLFFIQRL